MSPSPTRRSPLAGVRIKRPALLLVCKDCPAGRAIRSRTKAALKAANRKRALRVVACGCLDVCPRSGAAAMLATANAPARGFVIDGQADGTVLVSALLDERVSDAVPN